MSDKTMKAVRFHEYGEPSVLRHEDVEVPEPGPGQVRVKVAGTTFNGIDANIRAGFMQGPIPVTLPHTPGIDVSGTVDALGDDVDDVAVGDAVIAFLPMTEDGASAEHVLVPAAILAPAPTSIPLADAAALPVVALTAQQALFVHAGLQRGQRILVNGAGGAVGGYAVQLASAAGAHVIGTVTPSSRDRVLSHGAAEVVDRTSTTLADAVTEQVDVLLNLAPITPEDFAELVPLVRDGGVVVSTTVWMPTPGDDARGVRSVDLFVDSNSEQLEALAAKVDNGELAVDVAERVALSDLPDVHARAAAGELEGKVVVVL